MGKIKIYFTNGNTVTLEAEKTVFLTPPEGRTEQVAPVNDGLIFRLTNDGYTVVNWDEVSWVRKFTEPVED